MMPDTETKRMLWETCMSRRESSLDMSGASRAFIGVKILRINIDKEEDVIRLRLRNFGLPK